MAKFKCCVVGCSSTNNTHRLFCMPINDNLRSLWMSMLVPTSPYLLLLTQTQLMAKRVCKKHFDETQFDQTGTRIRYSYPCLFTEKEFILGVPLSSGEYNVFCEHNYCKAPVEDDSSEEPNVTMGMPGNVLTQEHLYSLPSTSDIVSSEMQGEGDAVIQEHLFTMPSTSEVVSSEVQEPGMENILLNTTKTGQHKSRKSTIKQFKSKTRRFIREVTNTAAANLGEASATRLQKAHKYAKNSVPLLENFAKLNTKAKSFLLMQLRLARKNKMARRFSLQDKLFALALMKQSPKGYKLLENIFALPNKRTLSRLSEEIIFECGINENIFKHIKMSIRNWEGKKKLCSLVFDEVSLSPRLTYNESKDKINGFVDIAGDRKQKFADHALVFMIRGICSSWRQSIAFYFCEGTVSAPELQNILKELITKISETGLKPMALVCDQGSTFRSCLKNMKAATARMNTSGERNNGNTIHIAGHELFLFHDPPHLLKGIRNNFIDKDIVFEQKRATWRDILRVYELDSKCGHTRALPKLTAAHVEPKNIKKMKVKLAAQVLSARTAAMLDYTISVYEALDSRSDTMAATSEFVLFIDELFDSVNGSPGQTKGKMRCAVKANSAHHEFWRNAIKKIKNMKFIDTNSKLAIRTGKPRYVRVPSLEGWITTLNSFQELSKLLFAEYGVEYFYPRLLNQDPLENFFGRIRAMNYRNVNPDVNAFTYAFKSLVISNILSPQSKFSNCEEDDGETLIDMNYIFESSGGDENTPPNLNVTAPSSSTLRPSLIRHVETPLQEAIMEKVKVQISAYTAGYICRKLTKKIKCHACTKTYITKEIGGIHKYIQYREFKRLKHENLAYPNDIFLRLHRDSAQFVHDYLNTNCHKSDVKKLLKTIIGKSDMTWLGCKKHTNEVKNLYKCLVIRLHCHNWCNTINRILNGRVEEKLVIKMDKIQMLALKKYKTHRLRQKATKTNK